MPSPKRLYFANWKRDLALLFLLATLPMACESSCQSMDEFKKNQSHLTKYQIHSVVMNEGKLVKHEMRYIPRSAFSQEPIPRKESVEYPTPGPRDKIHPVLKEWFAVEPPNKRVKVVINFRDNLKIPRFPTLQPGEPRGSKANQAVRARVDSLIRQIKQVRAAEYDSLRFLLGRRYGAEVIETYWLIKGVLADMTLRDIAALAEKRPDVLYIAPQYAGKREPPPHHDGNADNDVDDARRRIGSDPLYNLSFGFEYIGLFDTGILSSHTLFNSPSHIGEHHDCVSTSDCSGTNTTDCCDHGTATASILGGNGKMNDAFRGVTKFTVDIYKIYTSAGLDRAAAVRAFQVALSNFDYLLVVEMQAIGNEYSSISQAADNAFDAGAVVIAANGNNDDGYTQVKEPAVAHKVIGVGAFDIGTNLRLSSQCIGPTNDFRQKPDIQAPSRIEAASSASNNALTALPGFGGTSCATPFAAGAAVLLQNWYKGVTANQIPAPGQIYAFLILSGALTAQPIAGQSTTQFVREDGAGPINLPMSNGRTKWNTVTISNLQTLNVPLQISETTAQTLNAAVWWGERALDPHSDIDLELVDPNGNVRAQSRDVNGIFERARVQGALNINSGNWKIRLRGYSIPTGSQTVYWAIHYSL